MQTILCIDDQSDILQLYKVILESGGYHVLTATDGPTGLGLSREYSIDAVILDLQMPGMNGREVAEILSREQPALPVIISTGSAAQIPASLQRLARAVAEKGAGPRVLLSVLRDTLNGNSSTFEIAV